MKINVGLQLYTLREQFDLGLDYLFGQAAAMGYKGIEMIGMDISNADLKSLLDRHGLAIISAHKGVEELENNFDANVEYCKYLGTDKVTIPGVWGGAFDSWDSTMEMAKRLNALALKYAEQGIELSYHNHSHEFDIKHNGVSVEDMFYEYAPALKFELDMGWAFAAGIDVPAYIRKLGSRLHLVHIKDVNSDKQPVEVGNGNVNMKDCLIAAEEVGVKWGAVEQDTCVGRTALEAIKISAEYLAKL